MRIVLLCSSFNGLSQRTWIELRAEGHAVSVRLAGDAASISRDVAAINPDLILCPFLRERVPADVWQRYRTIIIHPGPIGDRGPSSLDWAITDGASRWGVTALQAVEEMDAGPIWASRTFALPSDPPRKSSLYNGPVVDAAIEIIHEVVRKATDPSFVPQPLDTPRAEVLGRLRPMMRQTDREFSWSDTTDRIIRRIRAADGSPGVHAELCDVPVSVFGAQPGPDLPGPAGSVAFRHHGAVLVRTGDGSVWIGQVSRRARGRSDGRGDGRGDRRGDGRGDGRSTLKLPAATALADRLGSVPELLDHCATNRAGHTEISYRRQGDVGLLHFDFHNGAMSTEQCRRLRTALRQAIRRNTRVLVIGGGETFSNGIHLNMIGASRNPAMEAWHNINAIDDVCREIITCTNQLVVASVKGNAGAGGVMMALGADRVVVRDGVVLNAHYRTMGLFGSEYWTYTLPRRVGHDRAQQLTEQCLPIGSAEALKIGLADDVLTGSPDDFADAVTAYAHHLAGDSNFDDLLDAKRAGRSADEARRPLDSFRVQELAEMSRDIFDDRQGFAARRDAFVSKTRPTSTPSHLLDAVDASAAAGANTTHAEYSPVGA